jgi:hypothetical protein
MLVIKENIKAPVHLEVVGVLPVLVRELGDRAIPGNHRSLMNLRNFPLELLN